VPFGVVVKLNNVAVGVLADEAPAMPEIAVGPADIETRTLQCGGTPFECLRAPGAERHMRHAGSFGGCELEAVALVVVPTAQKHRVSRSSALSHAENVNEEIQALVGFGGE